jgi:Family of unknown function (DUF6152)
MRNKLIMTFAIAVSLLVSVQLMAHHGNAAFDVGKEVTVKGTVTDWFWANPHCILQFDLKGENGQPAEHWVAETSNPPDMIATGWTKMSFKSGDQVTVTVQPVKSGKPVGRILQVVLPNGKTLSAFGGAKGAAARSAAAGTGAADPKVEEAIPAK